jgi:hypothetical protein
MLPYEWTCSNPGCKASFATFSQEAIDQMREEHLHQHRQEETEVEIKRREEEARKLAEELNLLTKKNYNCLRLTGLDLSFLKTRHIKTDDEDIEFDPSIEPKPTKESLAPGKWAEILKRAWLPNKS